jgi:hypothetical protein
MITRKVISALLFVIGYSAGAHCLQMDENKSVLYLRTCVEMLNNQGTSTGSTTNIGGFNLIYFYPLTPNLFAGFGYGSSFDLGAETLPIAGYSFHGKWYYRGQGTAVSFKENWGSSISRSTRAYYVGAAYVYNTYFLGHDPSSTLPKDNLSGEYSTVNAYTGADFAINNKFSWNAEGGMSILTMAASDNRVKIQTTFLYVGLSYIFD